MGKGIRSYLQIYQTSPKSRINRLGQKGPYFRSLLAKILKNFFLHYKNFKKKFPGASYSPRMALEI